MKHVILAIQHKTLVVKNFVIKLTLFYTQNTYKSRWKAHIVIIFKIKNLKNSVTKKKKKIAVGFFLESRIEKDAEREREDVDDGVCYFVFWSLVKSLSLRC